MDTCWLTCDVVGLVSRGSYQTHKRIQPTCISDLCLIRPSSCPLDLGSKFDLGQQLLALSLHGSCQSMPAWDIHLSRLLEEVCDSWLVSLGQRNVAGHKGIAEIRSKLSSWAPHLGHIELILLQLSLQLSLLYARFVSSASCPPALSV